MAYSQSLQVGLVQGGPEVPCKVTVRMSGSVVKDLLLTRYEELLNELNIEPKNEEIIGTFLSLAYEEGKQAEAKPWQRKKQEEKKEARSRDIQDINRRLKKEDGKTIIVLQRVIYLEDQLLPYLNQISFCFFQG